MEIVAVKAADWVVRKVLGAVTGTLLEAWAASKGLAHKVDALKVELLHAQAMVNYTQGREIHIPELKELMLRLQQLVYSADDVLDEIEYFRIQDELDGTYDAADAHAGGCVRDLNLHSRHVARDVVAKLKPFCGSRHGHPPVGKCLPCFSFQCVDGSVHTQAPKLKFNRVGISAKMEEITEHLKHMCAKVSNVLNLEFMGTSRITRKHLASKRPITTLDITETGLYGRDNQKKMVLAGIIHGKIVVLPIVGPEGIGKTTFTQHVYEELKSHFDVRLWICVSHNFTASRFAQKAVKQIPSVNGEKGNSSVQELIEQRLKSKRFLLVLDDMWECLEDEWKQFLAPFQRAGEKGSTVIVTTRMPEVAKIIHCPIIIEMEGLEPDDFMHFFEACVFGADHQQPWEGHAALREVGENIVSKLKGIPLAAKIVGRLLRNQLTLEHWTRVLESKEWEINDNVIISALKICYDYLPLHLQQCFFYCALFPKDYEFNGKEIVLFWIGLGIVYSCDLNQTIEETGQRYLDELVNHGFFEKNKRNDGHYVVLDQLYNLAVNISSFECLSICSSNIKSIPIRQGIRHLSIIIDNKDVEDINAFKFYKNELSALDKRLNIENLHTLMVFGEHQESFAKTFCDLFEKARAFRVICLSGQPSYTMVDNMFHKFSKLIHLRYIRIKSAHGIEGIDFSISALTRLYHLEIIDIHVCTRHYGLTRHMSNLAKLRHFLVPQYEPQLHSNIVEVGKLKFLQELRSFEVGRETKGFEISQLGQLSELRGSLSICSLERIRAMEDAHEARLTQRKHLHKLTLEWGANRPKEDTTHEENILEILTPCSNLKDLCIRGHGGTKCPKWLDQDISVKNLDSLCLDGVAWNTFPPIGELWLVNGSQEKISSYFHYERFHNLRRLELVNLPRLKNWVVNAPCHLFSHLEVLIIRGCSDLNNISFSHSICCQWEREEEANMNWFPSGLQELEIESCPNLSSIPPVPWTSTLCSTKIMGVALGFKNLVCKPNEYSGYCLDIKADVTLDDGTFWNVLAFDNLTELRKLVMDTCPALPHHHFQMLSSLKTLCLYGSSSIIFPLVEGDSHAEYQFPVECITVAGCDASAKKLTQLLTYFPMLSELDMWSCEKITGLAVVEKQAIETPTPASPDNRVVDNVEIEQHHQQQDGTRPEERGVSSAEGLLLLPSQLQKLGIIDCPELSLQSSLVDHSREAGQIDGGQGLQSLRSLRLLDIENCPRFLSSYSSSSSSSCPPFPTSVERLSLVGALGTATPLPLSNLASLTDLTIRGCGDLGVKGLRHLLTLEQKSPSSPSKLQRLWTDDVAGVLAPPICTLLSSLLTELSFCGDKEVKGFTKEQENALQHLTSLEEIRFLDCGKLQCLPAGLHALPNLKRLNIYKCPAIRSLPKDLLPRSLQNLEELNVQPSLRELNVRDSESKELRRQCRKLIGIIPVVYA